MNIKIPLWTKILISIALVGVTVWAIYAYGEQQYERGQLAERGTWQGHENVALTKANARITELEEDARNKERVHANEIAAALANYQEGIKNGQTTKDKVNADLRAGTLRLRVQLANTATGQGTAGGQAGTTGNGTGTGNAEATAQLSQSNSEFLLNLGSEADEIVHQLTACQAIVESDRNTQEENK